MFQNRPKRDGCVGHTNWSNDDQQLRTQVKEKIQAFNLPLQILSNDYIELPLPSFYPSINDYDKKDIPSDFNLVDNYDGTYKVGYYKSGHDTPYTIRTVLYTMRKFLYQFIQKQNQYECRMPQQKETNTVLQSHLLVGKLYHSDKRKRNEQISHHRQIKK